MQTCNNGLRPGMSESNVDHTSDHDHDPSLQIDLWPSPSCQRRARAQLLIRSGRSSTILLSATKGILKGLTCTPQGSMSNLNFLSHHVTSCHHKAENDLKVLYIVLSSSQPWPQKPQLYVAFISWKERSPKWMNHSRSSGRHVYGMVWDW